MEKIKKHKYEITLFIVDAIGMILELAASRILSPYFGSSNMVWTCVIAIILLSSSIGHYYGGKIADRPNQRENLEYILTLATLMIFLIPIISDGIISSISMTIKNDIENDDKEFIQDMVVIATNDAMKKIDAETEKALGAYGSQLGGLF